MDEPFLLRLHPLRRAGISLLISVSTLLVTATWDLSWLLRVNTSWLLFAISYLVLSWIVLCKRKVAQIRATAVADDGGVTFVFFMILISSFASLIMVMLLMISKEHAYRWLSIPVSIGAMLASWSMVHTVYAFHYAHRYYDDNPDEKSKPAKGLEFPGDDDPDYLDFVYFSFVIGCTFQVSDVEIASRKLRRIVLVHGLISFCLNTFVIALTINFIASLMH